MRNIIGTLIGLALRKSSFRFSKNYRWGTTIYHRAVYAMVDTIGANITAGLDDGYYRLP
tara:strand:+ start:378 stop:554 length:177 start_codon:yes stop_codon:yes gene_type:complete